jgi:hypothetical protein
MGTAFAQALTGDRCSVFVLGMTPRRRRFSQADSDALLRAVQECRRAAVQALTQAPIHSEGARAVRELIAVLDDLVEALTGEAGLFWAKPHSTPVGGGRSAS